MKDSNIYLQTKVFERLDGPIVGLPKNQLYRRFGKRVLDLGLAVLLVPLILPVVAVLWTLTRRDGGPGFFAQDRVGRDGRVFRCWKMRTMRVDAERILQEMCDKDPELAAEWHRNQKLKNDPRITPVGAFLRKTSLDELPQLWNVLRGEMSFVGPRPMLPSQSDLYVSGGGGKGYFTLRPGITGPWQVDGRGTTSFLERVRYDNAYLEEISVRKDLVYLVKTAIVPLRRTGA